LRAASAIRLATLPLSIALALAACAESGESSRPLAGASDAWTRTPEPTSSPSANPAHGAWEGYDELLRSPVVTSAPFASRGHLPEQPVDVRVNDVARPHFTALVTDTVFPDGSLLAELSHGATGHGYVMRKSAGHWSYFELDPRGGLLASGALALCVGCHDQAPADHVFGLPRAP
jgi:hypothetical protein